MKLRFCLPLLLAGSLAAQVTPPTYVPANTYTNAGTTGTTLHKLAKLSAANTVVRMATTDTDGALGICTANCSTSGKSTIQWGGIVACAFDGATTLGHYVTISASTAGDCSDAGATIPTSGQVIGVVLTTNGSAGNYNVNMQLRGPVPTATGVTSITLAGTANQITVTGVCTVTTTGTCTFSVPSDFRLPGTINKLTLTQPATGATVTILDGKTITVNKTLTFDGTDGVTITFPASSATVATLGLTNTFTGRQDAGGAASTAPNKVGTSLPGTCTVGDTFFKSNATTAGQNTYGCTSSNTWTLQGDGSGGASGGLPVCIAGSASATAYTCTTSPSFTPANGDSVLFQSDVKNSGAATLNVNSAGAKSIKTNGAAADTQQGDLLASMWSIMVYDGTNWQMQSQLGWTFPTAFGSWTQTVFPGGSAGDSAYGPLYISPASNSYAMLTLAQPSTPYTIDYVLESFFYGSTGFGFVGLRESATSKVTFVAFTAGSGLVCQNETSNTSFASFGCGTSGTATSVAALKRIYLRMQNTGSVLRWYMSPEGQHWNQFGSDVNVNTFFTTAPDQEVFGAFSCSGCSPLNSVVMLSRYVH